MRLTRTLFIITFLALTWGCSSSAEAVRSPPPESDGKIDQTGNAASTTTLPTPTPADIAAKTGRRQAIDDTPVSGPPPPLQFRKAGEDSEVATSMNSLGEVVETRVFRSHSKLVRVEAFWKNATEARLKIGLRNGKTIDVKTREITNLQSATTLDLLKIAGIATRPGTDERGKGKKTPLP